MGVLTILDAKRIFRERYDSNRFRITKVRLCKLKKSLMSENFKSIWNNVLAPSLPLRDSLEFDSLFDGTGCVLQAQTSKSVWGHIVTATFVYLLNTPSYALSSPKTLHKKYICLLLILFLLLFLFVCFLFCLRRLFFSSFTPNFKSGTPGNTDTYFRVWKDS